MPNLYRTQTGPRPDLNAAGGFSQADLGGYAFPKIFPIVAKREKGGTDAVASVALTAAKGKKSRANGTALTGSDLGRTSVTWSVSRYEGRGLIYGDDGASFSSEAAADKAGATFAQRQILNQIEQDAFDAYFTSTANDAATELAQGMVIREIQAAAHAVRGYGKPYLVMTAAAFYDFCNIPEVSERIANFAKVAGDIGFLALRREEIRKTISGLLAFEDVVIFDDDIVVASSGGNSAYGNKLVAVMGLRPEAFAGGDAAAAAVKDKAVQGIGYVYAPEPADAIAAPFDFYCWYDEDNKRSVFDAEAWVDLKLVAEAGHKMFKFADSYT